MAEFSIIEQYFKNRVRARSDVLMGIGDDCAAVQMADNKSLIVTTDTLVAGVHFHHEMAAKAVGHKALAVSLSDLAAMGAEAAWVTLSLTLPTADENWVDEFSQGFIALADFFNVQLIGGDTTQGPLSINVTAHGTVPQQDWLSRAGAMPGDWIFVTGTLGDAGLALDSLQQKSLLNESNQHAVMEQLQFPEPRLSVGQGIRSLATSALDLSDGLISDLGHILKASQVGAKLNLHQLPFSDAMLSIENTDEMIRYALSSGDDYELCFTVSEENKGALATALAHTGVKLTCIGQITGQAENLQLFYEDKAYKFEHQGYQHFS